MCYRGFWVIATPQKVVPWYFERLDEFREICERIHPIVKQLDNDGVKEI